MNAGDPNTASLEIVAEHLGNVLREQLVFVGGAVAGLLITDPALPDIRPTQDVDVICSVVGRSDYYRLGAQLRERGFMEDQRSGAPLCRWCIGGSPVSGSRFCRGTSRLPTWRFRQPAATA
jgi:hypothetical protein